MKYVHGRLTKCLFVAVGSPESNGATVQSDDVADDGERAGRHGGWLADDASGVSGDASGVSGDASGVVDDASDVADYFAHG